MENLTKDELNETLQIITSALARCEAMQPKFREGSSQNSLLKNRINALKIAAALITENADADQYTKQELNEALPPISSIIAKCQKARQKHEGSSSHYTRLSRMIDAIEIAKSLVFKKIDNRD